MEYTDILRYLQEALVEERFEQCQGFIDAALQAGAAQEEIKAIITAYVQGDLKALAQESKIAQNRLRLLSQKE